MFFIIKIFWIFSQWYSTNRKIVEFETRQYWYGRGAGCDFLTKNCFELINYSKLSKPFQDYSNKKNFKHFSDLNSNELKFPFCREKNLISAFHKSPFSICLSNGTHTTKLIVNCKIIKNLKMHPKLYEVFIIVFIKNIFYSQFHYNLNFQF